MRNIFLYIILILLPVTINAVTPIDAVRYYIEFDKHNSISEDTSVVVDELAKAKDVYNHFWGSSLINPYEIKLDSLPDSVHIDCSNFIYPLRSQHVTSRFGIRGCRFHYGTDIGLHYGDTVYAPFSGRIRVASYERRGYGHYIVIRHENGLETLMAHFSRKLVKVNDIVEAGQPIAIGGSSGRSTGPHLHLEFRFLGNAFNPEKLINFNTRELKTDEGLYFLTIADTYSHRPQLEELKKAAYHRVRSGETLSHIARRYGTSVRRLCYLNHIRETSLLQIGQRVRYR